MDSLELDISSTVTRLKRLSLTLPPRTRHIHKPVTLARLMDLSVERIECMAHSQQQDELLVASRLLESAKVFSRWEAEHAQVMRRVAEQRRSQQQTHELLNATFQFIHRKSLFDHLRQQRVTGQRRELLARHFSSARGYSNSIIVEHGIFLRSSASLSCSSYLGTNLLNDAVFRAPLEDYQQMYAAYFDAYCESVLMPTATSAAIAQSVVYSLKCDLGVLRRTILALANKISAQDDDQLLYP